MNPLHRDSLLGLVAAREYGLPLAQLLTDLRTGAHRSLTQPQLEIALRDLADVSYVVAFDSPLSGRRWRITALGKSALAEEGLG